MDCTEKGHDLKQLRCCRYAPPLPLPPPEQRGREHWQAQQMSTWAGRLTVDYTPQPTSSKNDQTAAAASISASLVP
ncbi:hypothetical protein LTR17_004197, partial [Elasticomyces elasticus]